MNTFNHIMDLKSEKDELMKRLEQIDDPSMIQAVKKLLDLLQIKSNEDKSASWLSPNEKRAVEQGLESISQGRARYHEDVMHETREKYTHLFKS